MVSDTNDKNNNDNTNNQPQRVTYLLAKQV